MIGSYREQTFQEGKDKKATVNSDMNVCTELQRKKGENYKGKLFMQRFNFTSTIACQILSRDSWKTNVKSFGNQMTK